MRIKYQPQDEAAQNSTLPVETNIGSFLPGQVVTVSDVQMKEAQRLIENGDFVATDEDSENDDEGSSIGASVKKAAAKVAAAVTPKSKK